MSLMATAGALTPGHGLLHGRLGAEAGDFAAEVGQREDGLVDEGVGLGAAGEAVRTGAQGLYAQAAERIDLAFDDAGSALVDRPKPHHLAAFLAGRMNGELEPGKIGLGPGLRIERAHARAFAAAWATVSRSA